MNVKLYYVMRGKKVYFAAEGDVHGFKGESASFRGFSVGDNVLIDGVVNKTGKITALKDDKTCFVETSPGVIEEIKYDRISKAQ